MPSVQCAFRGYHSISHRLVTLRRLGHNAGILSQLLFDDIAKNGKEKGRSELQRAVSLDERVLYKNGLHFQIRYFEAKHAQETERQVCNLAC